MNVTSWISWSILQDEFHDRIYKNYKSNFPDWSVNSNSVFKIFRKFVKKSKVYLYFKLCNKSEKNVFYSIAIFVSCIFPTVKILMIPQSFKTYLLEALTFISMKIKLIGLSSKLFCLFCFSDFSVFILWSTQSDFVSRILKKLVKLCLQVSGSIKTLWLEISSNKCVLRPMGFDAHYSSLK